MSNFAHRALGVILWLLVVLDLALLVAHLVDADYRAAWHTSGDLGVVCTALAYRHMALRRARHEPDA